MRTTKERKPYAPIKGASVALIQYKGRWYEAKPRGKEVFVI